MEDEGLAPQLLCFSQERTHSGVLLFGTPTDPRKPRHEVLVLAARSICFVCPAKIPSAAYFLCSKYWVSLLEAQYCSAFEWFWPQSPAPKREPWNGSGSEPFRTIQNHLPVGIVEGCCDLRGRCEKAKGGSGLRRAADMFTGAIVAVGSFRRRGGTGWDGTQHRSCGVEWVGSVLLAKCARRRRGRRRSLGRLSPLLQKVAYVLQYVWYIY